VIVNSRLLTLAGSQPFLPGDPVRSLPHCFEQLFDDPLTSGRRRMGVS
jgi:hypothetical protein